MEWFTSARRTTVSNALDGTTGAKLWSFATGSYVESSPAVADGVVYVGSLDGKVYAFGLPPAALASEAGVAEEH
jgi:outer membrane protein assembly factor BamB